MATLCVKYECRAPAALTSTSMADFYDTALEQIAWIDSLGFPVTINFCEHHGSEDAYLPSPVVLAAAAARVTKQVRLQVNVLVPGEARTEMNQESVISPYAVVSMALALLSHPPHGPNGHCFHRDGRHLAFANSHSYIGDLLNP